MPEPEETPPPVRQRNTTGYMVNVAETEDHPAHAVQPGEEAEFPALLDGWTAVEEDIPDASDDAAHEEGAPSEETPSPEPANDEAEAEPPTPKKSTPTRKRTATADTDTKDGGEPR